MRVEGEYRIVVKGELGSRFQAAFEGMTLAPHAGVTVISGPVEDSSHLHGILEQVQNLGLELISAEPARNIPNQAAE